MTGSHKERGTLPSVSLFFPFGGKLLPLVDRFKCGRICPEKGDSNLAALALLLRLCQPGGSRNKH